MGEAIKTLDELDALVDRHRDSNLAAPFGSTMRPIQLHGRQRDFQASVRLERTAPREPSKKHRTRHLHPLAAMRARTMPFVMHPTDPRATSALALVEPEKSRTEEYSRTRHAFPFSG